MCSSAFGLFDFADSNTQCGPAVVRSAPEIPPREHNSIGIAAPTDSRYSSSRLSITVTALPDDGTVYMPNGVTPLSLGEALSVTQLTQLLFKPATGLFGTTSTFTYKVMDPSAN